MEKKNITGKSIMERIKILLKSTGTTRDQLANYIGKNKQVFTDWKTNNIVPKADDLYNISKFFSVPMEYLMFGEETIPDNIAVICAMISTIPQEKQQILLEIIAAQCNAWRENENNPGDIQ